MITLATGRDISKMMSLDNKIGEDAEKNVMVLDVIINNVLQTFWCQSLATLF